MNHFLFCGCERDVFLVFKTAALVPVSAIETFTGKRLEGVFSSNHPINKLQHAKAAPIHRHLFYIENCAVSLAQRLNEAAR